MNAIAAKARTAASHLEVKKDSLRQTQDGLWKITLTAAELPAWLLAASMGTRMVCALVQIGDDEQPVAPEVQPVKTPKPFASLPAATQAGIVCADPVFWRFLRQEQLGTGPVADENAAAAEVRRLCGVKSRAELTTDPKAHARWQALLRTFVDFKEGIR